MSLHFVLHFFRRIFQSHMIWAGSAPGETSQVGDPSEEIARRESYTFRSRSLFPFITTTQQNLVFSLCLNSQKCWVKMLASENGGSNVGFPTMLEVPKKTTSFPNKKRVVHRVCLPGSASDLWPRRCCAWAGPRVALGNPTWPTPTVTQRLQNGEWKKNRVLFDVFWLRAIFLGRFLLGHNFLTFLKKTTSIASNYKINTKKHDVFIFGGHLKMLQSSSCTLGQLSRALHPDKNQQNPDAGELRGHYTRFTSLCFTMSMVLGYARHFSKKVIFQCRAGV